MTFGSVQFSLPPAENTHTHTHTTITNTNTNSTTNNNNNKRRSDRRTEIQGALFS